MAFLFNSFGKLTMRRTIEAVAESLREHSQSLLVELAALEAPPSAPLGTFAPAVAHSKPGKPCGAEPG